MINNRLGILLAEKRMNERRKISLVDMSKETGIPHKTLHAWAHNEITRFDAHVIAKICKYFKVKPGDLIEYVEERK